MQVKVWNDNIYDFKDPDFKGTALVVPSKGYITMDWEEACEFRGKFSPMPPEDHPNPELFFKMIRVEMPVGGFNADIKAYTCHRTGKTFHDADSYIMHMKKMMDEHRDDFLVDPVAERLMEQRKAQ